MNTVMSSLNARINAIKMLHSRICLLQTYLGQLPESYLTDKSSTFFPPAASEAAPTEPSQETNYTILRSIQALLCRLPLVVPADKDRFEEEALQEKNDVNLVALLGMMNKTVMDVRELGKRFSVGTLPLSAREGRLN